MRTLISIFVLTLSAFGQANLYSSWSNFPQSNTYFPIALFEMNPSRSLGAGAPFTNDATGMKGIKATLLLEIDNGGGRNYPTTCNTDTGSLASTLFAQGIDLAPFVVNSTNTCASPNFATVGSLQTIATNLSDIALLPAYNLGDEPESGSGCTTLVPTIPATMTKVHGFDSTRPFLWNMTDWPLAHGSCAGSPDPNIAALKAIDIGSFDYYPITAPWSSSAIPIITGTANTSGTAVTWVSGSTFTTGSTWNNQPIIIGGAIFTIASVSSTTALTLTTSAGTQTGAALAMYADAMWLQGRSLNQFAANGRVGQPIWAYVETGTTELAYSMQNSSTCTPATNLCTPHNNEYRATAEQVNAEAWMTIINGGMGIEWFCDDQSTVGNVAFDFCLGNTLYESTLSASIAANLLYVDTNVLNFAPQLNSNVSGQCTMNTGDNYTNFTTSCSNGILTMSTGTSNVPGSAIVKSLSGTPYLFADTDRIGQAAMTFTLTGFAGYKATVVYDSNAQYDAGHSTVGQTFILNGSGQFTDTLGANGHNYQPKIYSLSVNPLSLSNISGVATMSGSAVMK